MQIFDLPFQHILVKENYGAECLVLGGGADPSIYGEIIQETLNFAITHHLRVLLVIEQNELADPVEIGFLCSIAVLLRPDFCANRLQKREFDTVAPQWLSAVYVYSYNEKASGMPKILRFDLHKAAHFSQSTLVAH